MPGPNFVHLHNHTEYSLLDGATRIKQMAQRAKELEMPAIAISDHGVMFGAMEHYYECEAAGIKPIIGMEAYVAPQGHLERAGGEKKNSYHLLLLAKDIEGYQNLCRLHSIAALEGFYYKPRVDHDLLREHSKGLISSTTCLGSEINQFLMDGDYDKAQYTAGLYKDIFEEGSYFVELQNHGIPEQKLCNEQLVKIAKELKLPIVATNDAHFLCQTDSQPHDVLLCIGLGKMVNDENRIRFQGQEYIKTAEEMLAALPEYPEAIENSLMIAEKIDLQLGNQRAMMPTPTLEEGHDERSYLRHLSEQGLRDRCPNATDENWDRLNYELDVIAKTGFDAYLLLVKEFAQFARSKDIAMGVRGSAAGSLVAYTLGITDVDPVEYDLTFERFLNPERVSMPDIDMDFEDRRRDEIIQWVTETYGKDRVAQIITFGTLGPKAAIRDAARVMDKEPREADLLCKAIPTGPGWSIDKALKEVADFQEMVKSNPEAKRLVDTAQSIEGLSRHAGVHAAGVVIANESLKDIIPLYRGGDGQAVTAYEMGILERLGLLKMDFLGLSNLTVVARCIENIRESLGVTGKDEQLIKDHPILDGIQAIPLDDQKTYDMLSAGDTTGVFQLESGGMRRNIMELKPQSVRELAAMVALYRPGPMSEIPRFISNKFGRTQIEVLHKLMEPILAETYGIIVYQDQVMKLVQALAGFSLGKADILRRAMGKKKADVMDQMMPEFFDGCVENGVDRKIAEKVWELLLPFAGYAFNKAHAVCYAFLAYQTAYLKANYPEEYMAALVSAYQSSEERVIVCIEECRHKKIPVLPPEINSSMVDFHLAEHKGKKSILFGMGAIKNVGHGLVNAIIEERKKKPFTHLYEFAERLREHGLNKASLDALIKAGALASIDPDRGRLHACLEPAMAFADIAVREKLAGQNSLFGGGGKDDEQARYPELPIGAKLTRSEVLAMEKEVMGIYVSDHPLRGMERTLLQHATHKCEQVAELAHDTKVSMAGIISSLRSITTRKGTKMAELTLEDFTGQAKCLVFSEPYGRLRDVLEKDAVVVVNGFVMNREGQGGVDRAPEVRVKDVRPLPKSAEIMESIDPSVEATILMRVKRATRPQLQQLKSLIESAPGSCEVVVHFVDSDVEPIVLLQRVAATQDMVKKMEKLLDDAQAEVLGDLPLDRNPQPEPHAAVAG